MNVAIQVEPPSKESSGVNVAVHVPVSVTAAPACPAREIAAAPFSAAIDCAAGAVSNTVTGWLPETLNCASPALANNSVNARTAISSRYRLFIAASLIGDYGPGQSGATGYPFDAGRHLRAVKRKRHLGIRRDRERAQYRDGCPLSVRNGYCLRAGVRIGDQDRHYAGCGRRQRGARSWHRLPCC